MNVNDKVKKEILDMVHQKYSVSSICKRMNTRHPDLSISETEIVEIAESVGIKGLKYKSEEKSVFEQVEDRVPAILNKVETKKKVTKNIVIILLCLCVFIAVVYFQFGLKITLYSLLALVLLLTGLCIFTYFRFIKGHKKMENLLKMTKNKK